MAAKDSWKEGGGHFFEWFKPSFDPNSFVFKEGSSLGVTQLVEKPDGLAI